MNKALDDLKEYLDIQLNHYRKELETDRYFKSLLEITGKDKVLANFLERQEVMLCMFIAKLNTIKEQVQGGLRMKLKDLVNCNTNNFATVTLIANDKKIYTGSHSFNVNASNDYGIDDKLLECEVISYEVYGEYWEIKEVKPSIDYLKCTAFGLNVKIELPKENEDNFKLDNDTLFYFLRKHKDLDEKRVIVRYTNIEGRLVYIRLSNLIWNWERMSLILNYKIEHQEIRDDGDLILYLEDCRKG